MVEIVVSLAGLFACAGCRVKARVGRVGWETGVRVCRNELRGSAIDFLCVKCWGCFLEGAGITWRRRSLKLRALAQLLKLTPPPKHRPVRAAPSRRW